MHIHRWKKKAQTSGPPGGEPPFIILFSIAIPLLIFVFMGMVFANYHYSTKVPLGVKEYVLINKFVSSEECFAYYDSVAAEYLSLSVNLDLFKQGITEACYPAEPGYNPVRLTLLRDKDSTLIRESANWNKESGPDKRFEPQPVIIYESGERTSSGKIVLEIQDV